jgi:hypothetical protein
VVTFLCKQNEESGSLFKFDHESSRFLVYFTADQLMELLTVSLNCMKRVTFGMVVVHAHMRTNTGERRRRGEKAEALTTSGSQF